MLIHCITKTQDDNTDDISLHTINEHLELELREKELDRTHRLVIKRPRPVIVKFARCNTRRKVFKNIKKVKKYWKFNYRKPDQTQDGTFKKSKSQIWI